MDSLFAGFNYLGLENLGDYIQSFAAEQFIPTVNRRFNRDDLRNVKSSKEYFLIMNGWFSHTPENCFPLSDNFHPIFWGLHLTNWNNTWEHLISERQSIDYFKLHQPIGCRDQFTQQQLEKQGIQSFYSKCLTLTFPKREKKIRKGWNVIVDVPIPLPPQIEDNSVRLTHSISGNISEHKKRLQAKKNLDFYRDFASTVITTRLHCALPCIAMGIPVIFLGNPQDYRISILKDVGLNINNFPSNPNLLNQKNLFKLINKIWDETDWTPSVIDFEDQKTELIKQFQDFLSKKMQGERS